MKKSFFAIIICMCFMMCACMDKTAMAHIEPTSYLTGWYVDGDMVYIVCKLIIVSQEEEMVYIDAYSDEDKGELLENAKLTGYNEDMSSTVFTLHEGRNEAVVVFAGVYGKSRNKADYEVPDKIVLRKR